MENVEIFDRHNGVPSLGVFRTTGRSHLFWRTLGYTGDISFWLYVPLTPEDEEVLDNDEGPGILDGLVYQAREERYVTVGVADYYRLIFEREWRIPQGLTPHDLPHALVEFVTESLQLALSEGLPASRRDIFQKAHEAARHLVSC
nr:hypothetical protein [Micromonospora sp. DSM 115978]